MSTEDDHYVPTDSHFIPGSEIAGLRQELYDAKLLLHQGRTTETLKKLIEALDRTTRWP